MTATTSTPIKLDCGHMSTPDGFATGYATDAVTDRRVCYACAADGDRRHVSNMTSHRDVLVAYLRPVEGSTNRVEIVTWPGVKLGSGTVADRATLGTFGDGMKYVSARITDAEGHDLSMWGWTPAGPYGGDYVRLRPTARALRDRATWRAARRAN